MSRKLKIGIIGGGLSGLAAADHAAQLGAQVELFEAASELGGMARSHTFGQFSFDLGPHSFYPRRPEMAQLFTKLLPEQDEAPVVHGAIYRAGIIYRYPWSVVDFLTKNPPKTSTAYLASYLFARSTLIVRRRLHNQNFEDWCRVRFGGMFYEFFLHGHLLKSYGVAPQTLPWVWAAQRISVPSLFESIGDLFKPRKRSGFGYYPKGGIGALAKALAASAEAAGAHVYTGRPVTKIVLAQGRVLLHVLDGDAAPIVQAYDHVITTMALPETLAILNPSPSQATNEAIKSLRYRAAIFAFFSTQLSPAMDYELCYFPGPDEEFIRIYEPRRYSSVCAPPGRSSICVEFHCDFGDSLWEMSDEDLGAQTKSKLSSTPLLRNAGNIELLGVERMRYHYPLETPDSSTMSDISQYLAQLSPQVISCGRLGSFKYTNMDDAILMGQAAADVSFGSRDFASIAAVADRTTSIETATRA